MLLLCTISTFDSLYTHQNTGVLLLNLAVSSMCHIKHSYIGDKSGKRCMFYINKGRIPLALVFCIAN